MRRPYTLLLPGVAAIILATSAQAFARTRAVLPLAGECDEAQILDISGKWVANPGERELAKWDCVKAGDDLLLADDAPGGSVTIIFRKGAKPPLTVLCPTRDRCRNAYRIKSDSATAPASNWDGLLDFVFSFFKPRKPTPVPGILHGALTPPSQVLCSVNGKVSPTIHASMIEASLRPLDEGAPKWNWASREGLWNAEQGHLDHAFVYELKIPASGRGGPFPREAVQGWVLVAPESSCRPLQHSVDLAIRFRHTWPKETPESAAATFYLMYLDALARAPESALRPQ